MNTFRSVPSDPKLPALVEMVSPDSTEFIRQAAGPLMDFTPSADSPKLHYVRYRPGIDCIVGWEFSGPGGESQLVSGRMFSDGRDSQIIKRHEFKIQAEAARGSKSFCHLPNLGVLAQAFPLDYRLPDLMKAASNDWARTRLASLGLCEDTEAIEVEALPGSFKPWIRSVLRYKSVDRHGQVLCFAKVTRRNSSAPNREVLAVADQLNGGGAPWRVVVPFGDSPGTDVSLIGPSTGTSLAVMLDAAVDNEALVSPLSELMARAAEGIASLQSCGVTAGVTVTPQTILAEFRRKVASVGRVDFLLQSVLTDVLRALESAASTLDPEQLRLSHGAFRHEHLVADGSNLEAIDMDNLRMAGASADAGSFLAFLDVAVVNHPRESVVSEQCADRFVSALADSSIGQPEWVSWYRGAGHLKWALRAFFSLEPNWYEKVLALADLANETTVALKTARARVTP